ncbi:MAG: glycine cleavage system H-protein subunit [Alectoria sarmentosa]|nr:MAG: glycine cleavage system H-protein subunit [Alectoria sarmentosa]
MAVSSLRIGIETEFLLRAHEKQDQCKSTLKEFADALVRHYNAKVRDRPGRTEMRMAFDTWHASEDPANFGYWSVVEEVSIDPDEDHWGLEFASPIMRYEAGSPRRQNLRVHFQIIESYAEILPDVTCGTHVHVSPGDSKWTLEQAKNVSRSILYFEEAFEVLLPPERRGNRECRSNQSDNPKLKDLPDLKACFEKIQECGSIKALIHLMNGKDEDQPLVCEEWNGEIAVTERCYGFNFENLMEGKIGTIEFRRPPCVTNYQDCVMWAEFGASFMQAAMQYGASLDSLRRYGLNVAGLAAFVEQATIHGMNDRGILAKMFARGSVHEKKYTEDHEWIELSEDGKTGTIGVSVYAAKSLGDVVFVELPALDIEVTAGDSMGAVESVKSASDILTPVSGKIIEANNILEEKPATINKSPEGEGWIARIQVKDGGELESLMSMDEYAKFTAE